MTPSRSPNSSVCAAPTARTTPTVGLAMLHRARMWPMPRAPISITAAAVSSGAFTSVSGTPSSLLNERRLACVGRSPPRTAARRSFVVVFPTEPVMPMTAPGSRVRACAPSRCNAAVVSSTSTWGTSAAGPALRTATAPAEIAPGMKSWPSRSATMGTNNCGPLMSRESIDTPEMDTASPTRRPPVARATSSRSNLIPGSVPSVRWGPGDGPRARLGRLWPPDVRSTHGRAEQR